MYDNPLEQSWHEYTNWLRTALPVQYELLNSPADSNDFEAFKNATGRDFPVGLRKIYELNNGAGTSSEARGSFWAGYEFLDITGIIHEWQGNVEAVDGQNSLEDGSHDGISDPEGAIKVASYNANWIPFLHDGSGNFIGIDLDPGATGTVGQVINFGRDESYQSVIANSAEDFIAAIVRQINADNIEIEGNHWYIKDHDYFKYGFHLDAVEFGPQTKKIFFVPRLFVASGDNRHELTSDWAGRILPGQTMYEGVAAELKEVYGYTGRAELGKSSFLDNVKDNKGNNIQRYSITVTLYPTEAEELQLHERTTF